MLLALVGLSVCQTAIGQLADVAARQPHKTPTTSERLNHPRPHEPSTTPSFGITAQAEARGSDELAPLESQPTDGWIKHPRPHEPISTPSFGIAAQAKARGSDELAPLESPPSGEWIKAPRPHEGEQSTAGLDGLGGNVERDGYVSVQVNVDVLGRNIVGDAANEPSIAIDPTDPRKMAIGWRQFDSVESDFRQAGYGFSHDGGQTWTFPGTLDPGIFGTDPVLDSDAGGTLYFLTINFDEMRLFRSLNGGVTWSNPVQVAEGFWDKPWMIIDRTDSPGRGNIYIHVARSYYLFSGDGGHSFSKPLELSFDLGASILALDDTGSLYATRWGGNRFQAVRSDDIAVLPDAPTFSVVASNEPVVFVPAPAPNPSGLPGQLWVATHSNPDKTVESLYLLSSAQIDTGTATYSHVLFTRSTDRGRSWTNFVRVDDDTLERPDRLDTYRWFAMMSVAPNGRIDAVWNDGRANPGDSSLTALFYSYSIDSGDTWSSNVPVSPIFDSFIGRPTGSRKLGDYYHMRSDNLGVNVAYAATFNAEQDIWFLRIGPHDCNANEVPDETDIRRNTSRDRNGNGIPDECELFGDFNGDSRLDLRDYQGVQLCFGAPSADLPGPRCARLDLDLDNNVDLVDLRLLSNLLEP